MSKVYMKVALEPRGRSHHECLWTVREVLHSVEGIHEIMVDTDCRYVIVAVCPNKIRSEQIIAALRSAGFGTRGGGTMPAVVHQLPSLSDQPQPPVPQ